MPLYSTLGTLRHWIGSLPLPDELVAVEDLPSILDEVYVLNYEFDSSGDRAEARTSFGLASDMVIEIPGLKGVEFVIGDATANATVVNTTVKLTSDWEIRFRDIELAVRFDPSVLAPPPGSTEEQVSIVTSGDIVFDHTWSFSVEGYDALDLTPAQIGETGVVVSAQDLKLDLSRTTTIGEVEAAGFGESFIGIYVGEADIVLPESLPVPEDLTLKNCAIGSGGISGEASMTSDDLDFDEDTKEFTGDGAGELGGFAFGLREVNIEFKQNALVSSKIKGELFVPYFEKRVTAEVGFDLDGALSIRVTGPTKLGETDDSFDPESGLLTLDTDAFELKVESIELTVGDPSEIAMAGTVTPTIEDLDVPGLDVEELVIDENGNVLFEGGWIDLPDQYSASFYGITLELSKLGFGKTDAGERWVGLNGEISIVEGVPAGASVEGLRIFWDNDGFDRIELNGIGIEFEVPETVRFKGEVAFGGEAFTGEIELDLISLGMSIDAELVVGEQTQDGQTFTYFSIYLDADLPAGIPLFTTGTGIYGFAGLFAHQMEPDKGDDQKWYDVTGGNSWYHEGETGVTDLTGKWRPRAGGLGLGAGVSIATLPDNGFSVEGDLMLVLVFPGPIIMLQGKAKMLSPSGADKDSSASTGGFRTLAVLDNREGSFTFGLDAQYRKGGGDGTLIDIQAGVEAFFSFHDPTAWHLYMGRKEPPEDRIRAEALYLFTADAYFMLDADKLALGAKVGYDADWTFGPVGVIFEAWIASNAMVNWNPLHFFGELLAHGKVAIKAFGFSMGLSIDARIAADVYDPFHLIGEFSVAMSLPWPLPDPSVDVTLEWGPKKAVPPVPRPLEGVAIGHEKSTARWPLSRESESIPGTNDQYPPLMRPNYADDGLLDPDGLDAGRPAINENPPAELPVVPPDARPKLTFAKPVHDDGNVGVNHQAVKPAWEVIGDPSKNQGPIKVRYELAAVRLKRREGSSWTESGDLYGSWAPLPKSQSGTGGSTKGGGSPTLSNTKLELYSKNPFDYGRHSHGTWEEGTQRLLEDYPCTVDVECFDFGGLGQGPIDEADFTETRVEESGTIWYKLTRNDHPQWPTISIQDGEERPTPIIEEVERPENTEPALVYPPRTVESGHSHEREEELLGTRLQIDLAEARPSVRLVLGGDKHPTDAAVTAYDNDGVVDQEVFTLGWEDEGRVLTFASEESKIESLSVDAMGAVAIVSICQSDADFEQIGPQETSGIDHTRDELLRWADEDDVLEPNTVYRLEVDTVVEARGKSGGALEGFSQRWYDDTDPLTEFVYFRTGGPPGINPESSLPTTVQKPETFATGLEDLTRYVAGTIPETVPAKGEKPIEPRPVYRAYDVGVDFAENYVETLYRMVRRDLGLYLFDTNDRPVRNVNGQLVATENQWGKTDSLLLSEHDRAWLRRVRESGCMDIEEDTIPMDDALATGQGVVLDPAQTYETRLTPLLVREPFDDDLDHWEVDGDSSPDWTTPGHGSLSGEDAMISGTTVKLDGNPSLEAVTADADSIHFPGDRSDSADYRIVGVDNGTNEITLDAAPDIADDRRWQISPRHELTQTAMVADGATNAPESTLELAGHPKLDGTIQPPDKWTDYRVSATLRADTIDSGSIGLAFRRDGSGDHYRFELDAGADEWKLVRAQDDDEEVLARHELLVDIPAGTVELPDDIGGVGGFGETPIVLPWNAIEQGHDYRVTVEAIGSDLRVYVNDELIFAVEDDALSAGTVGVYCRAVEEAHVPEIRVEDYRCGENAGPVPYQFTFTTSKYANFFHQAHSYQDETWQSAVEVPASGTDPAAQLNAAVSAMNLAYADLDALTPPLQTEVRSYDAALSILDPEGTLARRSDRVTVTRFDRDGAPLAYLLQSPEPIAWDRTDLTARYLDADELAPSIPGIAKLTDVTLGSDESVTLLFREEIDPTDYAIDYRRSDEPGFELSLAESVFHDAFDGSFGSNYNTVLHSPGPIVPDPGEPILPDDSGLPDGYAPNGGDEEVLLDLESRFFSDLASDSRSIPSLSDLIGDRRSLTTSQASGWDIEDGNIVGGGSRVVDVVAREGAAADGVWTTTISADAPGEFGLLFRYAGENDHYRFSISADAGLRLVHRHGGSTDVLWHGGSTAIPDREYRFTVLTDSDVLRGYLDDIPAFVVADPRGSGRVGVHAGRAGELTITDLSVHETGYESVLFADNFTDDLDAWEFKDIPPYTSQESDWYISGGRLHQTSNIYGHVGNEYHEPGTHGVAGDPDWRDYRVTATLGSGDNDAIGMLVRYQDRENYYRFSMDHERKYRRLVKHIDGTTYLLWQDDEQYDSGREYTLTVECVGDTLTGYLDGEQLFEVQDSDLTAGQMGLYCRANDAAYFDDVRVTAPANGWVPYYEFAGEETLPAGTRVRINRGTASPDEASLVQRALARDGDGPSLLPTSGVDLRVRAPGVPIHAETAGHVRRFLPDENYQDLDAKALRNADGTGLILVPVESVDAGQLRLDLTYHRDAGKRTLRQAGYSDPENAVLDVPWTSHSESSE